MNNSFSNLMNIYVNDQVDQEVEKGTSGTKPTGTSGGKRWALHAT